MIKSRAKALEKPMAHQAVSLAHDAKNPIVFDASDAGTGKTGVRIWAFAGRRRKRGGCLLVLAPRSLLRAAWAADFAKFAPDMVVSVADANNRAAAFAVDADVYVTNHDAVKDLAKQPKAWFAKFSELVIDESPAYKHHTSQRSRAAAKIKAHFKQRKILTATPTSNGICDIWHQVYLLDDGKTLGPSFFAFRNTVCEAKQVGRSAHAIAWTDKPGAEEAVFGLLTSIVVRHRFDDCVDIPKTHAYTVPYEMVPKQRKAYDQMANDQLLPMLNGSAKITAVNAAAVATKLLQIASGAVYDGSGKYQIVDRTRYETLIEMAAARRHPLMLFFWQHQRDMLVEEAEKRGMKFGVFDGDSNDTERLAMVRQYQRGEYDILFGHPQTVAHGLTLTAGTSVIWPGPTYNLEWWTQANARQARIGQTRKTEIVTSLATNSIEEKVYAMREVKGSRMSNLLDLFDSMSPKPAATIVARKLMAAV